jgi:hypothetical protein
MISNNDNTFLDLLLIMRSILANELNITKNNLLSVQGLDIIRLNAEGIKIHDSMLNFFQQKYDANLAKNQQILADLDDLVNRSCNHEVVEDEIETTLFGDLVQIRYCKICETTF